MMISYGCVYKRSSKPVMKGSRVETIESAKKEYKELLEKGWKKTSIFIATSKHPKVIFEDSRYPYRSFLAYETGRQ